jgi:hypothetical protein
MRDGANAESIARSGVQCTGRGTAGIVDAKRAGISDYRAEWLSVEIARDPALMPPATVL